METIHLSTKKQLRIIPRTKREALTLASASIIAIILLAIDQATKIWADKMLQGHAPIEVIPNFFSLLFVTNKGAAWGIFHGYSVMLMIIAVIVTILAFIYFRKLTEGFVERYYAVMIILSGVVGNAIDRLWRGHVVDFLDFNFWGYHFPTFNIADSAISCGVALYILSTLLRPNPESAPDVEREK